MRDQTKSRLQNLRPSVFPDPGSEAAFKLQSSLADSEWLAREQLEQSQLRHLKRLVHFAAREAAFWQGRLDVDAILRATQLQDALALIPTLSRADVVNNKGALHASALPPGQRVAGELQTSGSTGGVVSLLTTNLAMRLQYALDVRAQLWAKCDFSHSIAVVRRLPRGVSEWPGGSEDAHWESPAVYPFPTGSSFRLNTHNASLDQIWNWLTHVSPTYLVTYPSIVRGLAEGVSGRGRPPLVVECIMTIGEVVDQELRKTTAQNLHTRIHDTYSSQEAGVIATQCPDSDVFHVQAEMVIVEILDDDDAACGPGEIGRVVVTPLFNYATPLLRYEMGDFAEAGPPCTCGRGLPVLNRIKGRRRNLLTLSDGRRFWPSSGARQMDNVVRVRQHQFRQVASDLIEVLLVTDEPITSAQEIELRRIVVGSLPGNLSVRICRVSEIPRQSSGKHEEFISLLTQG